MIEENKIFDKKGELRAIELVGDIVDTIMVIAIINPGVDIHYIDLELRKCGFFISHPTLRNIKRSLISDGILSDCYNFNLN